MPRKTVRFFYDCLSPFSFFAFQTFRRYQTVWNIELELKPILLGIVMASTGNIPPGARPWAKYTRVVSEQDMERNKIWFNVPNMKGSPSNFFGPKGPTDKSGLARDFRYMRMLSAVELISPKNLADATDGVFKMIHCDDREKNNNVIVSEMRLQQICVKSGMSPKVAREIVDSINTDDVKENLKNNIADAIKNGAYGSPFFMCEDQVYFGSDRLEQFAFVHGFPWYGPDPSRPSVAKL